MKNNPRCPVSASSWDTEGPVYNLAAVRQNVHVLQLGKEEWKGKKNTAVFDVCPQIGDLKHYYSFRLHGTAKWAAESKQDVTSTVAQEPEVKERDTSEDGLFISGTSTPCCQTHTHLSSCSCIFTHRSQTDLNWQNPVGSKQQMYLTYKKKHFFPINR